MGMTLFDQTICAFKIGDEIIEVKRSTHDKTYSDLIQCTLLPKTAEICFIDNTYYENMLHDRVYYIKPKSYFHPLSVNAIVQRFINMVDIVKQDDKSSIMTWFHIHGITSSMNHKKEIDLNVSQKILYHIKEFFFLSSVKKNKTKRICISLGKFTRKKRV